MTRFDEWLEAKRGPAGAAAICAGYVLFALPLVWPLRWRLRVDDQGLSRRRMWFWDHWSWFEVKNGQIRKRPSPRMELTDPARPLWRRTLGFGYMDEADRAEVFDAINARYPVPRAPALPERLELRYAIGCSLTLDARGLRLRVLRKVREYAWSDVRSVLIKRMDPMRRDFTSVVITPPDRDVPLRMFDSETPTTREVVNEFFVKHVPAAKLDVTLAGEPPNHRFHIERGLRTKRKDRRELNICLSVCFAALAVVLVWGAFDPKYGVIWALVMTAMSAILLGPVLVYFDRLQRQRIAALERRMREVAGEG